VIIYVDEALLAAIRRLRMAQAADGARVFSGTVQIAFTDDEATLSTDDPTWTAADDRTIDTRLIRDTSDEHLFLDLRRLPDTGESDA
jgi:hypothetical protein